VNLVPFPAIDYRGDFITATDAPFAALLLIDEAPWSTMLAIGNEMVLVCGSNSGGEAGRAKV